MQSHSSLQILSKRINKDLSNLSNWLKTNKLSLNIKKTELVLFRPKKLKLDHSFKFKIDGKRLIPIHSVKYLGVLLDEHMSWNEQIYQIKLKLNRAIGILSKLRSHANVNTLRIACYSLFQSHLQYGIQLWDQKNQEIKEIMQKLQNRALRKINFKKFYHSIKPIKDIYKDHKILKFADIFSCIRLNKIMHLLPLFLISIPKTNTITRPGLQPKTC